MGERVKLPITAIPVPVAEGGTGAALAADARTNLGLASMAVQAASAVAITGGTVLGITDLAVVDGGTGASLAADARTNLGLASMAVQAASAVAITGGTVLGITDLAVADGGTGASLAADARTNLGIGSMGVQAASAVAITGGTIGGITDLAVVDGGTGASDAPAARTNLGIVQGSTCQVTMTGNLAVVTATDTIVSWAVETWDTDGYHSAGDATKLVAPATGYYLVSGLYSSAYGAASNSQARILVNGTAKLLQSNSQVLLTQVSGVLYLTVGQYVEFQVRQESGSDKAMIAASSYFQIYRLA